MDKIAKEAYAWLKENAYGEENGKSLLEVAQAFLPNTDNAKREMRRIISAINSNTDLGLVSTSGKIYLCKTQKECEKAIKTTWRFAIAYLKKAKTMSAKASLNGQFEITDDNGKKIRIVYED